MKTIYSKSILLAALAMLMFTVPAFSQMKDMSMKEHHGGHGQMMEMGKMDKMDNMLDMCIEHADKMGLTADQMQKMKPLHREMQKKQVRFRADLKIAEIELAEILDVKDFDLDKATSAVRKSADIRTAHQVEMVKAMKEMRTLLTDEQFKNMKKMHMKSGEKRPAKKMMKK